MKLTCMWTRWMCSCKCVSKSLFFSCYPTRLARHGNLLTKEGNMDVLFLSFLSIVFTFSSFSISFTSSMCFVTSSLDSQSEIFWRLYTHWSRCMPTSLSFNLSVILMILCYRLTKLSLTPLQCECSACMSHTRAYLHHLFKSKFALSSYFLSNYSHSFIDREPMFCVYAATHNLHYMLEYMKKIRAGILNGELWNDSKVEKMRRGNNSRPFGNFRRRIENVEKVKRGKERVYFPSMENAIPLSRFNKSLVCKRPPPHPLLSRLPSYLERSFWNFLQQIRRKQWDERSLHFTHTHAYLPLHRKMESLHLN